MCAGIDDYIGSQELASCSIRNCDLQGFRADELSGAENQFSTGFFVVLQVNVVPARDHHAFAFANTAHINAEVSAHDAELTTSAEVRGYFRAVNDVLAGQTSDVRAGATDVFPVDNRYALPLTRKSPRGQRASRAAAQN